MAAILCLETSSINCSVALGIDGKLVSLREESNQKYLHAEKLHVFIEEVLKEANFDMAKLDAIAVSKGPGSYTGLRIGVSAAKGLCFALGIPLISIPTLEVLIAEIELEKDCFVIPLIDARRLEVYSAVFDSKKKQIHETKAEVITENSFEKYLDQKKTIFIGDGASKFKALCNHENAYFQEATLPSAKNMISIAASKNKISDIEDVAYFEPFYLKEFMLG